MKLNVAVQMDPIARINIRGDSTFALLLEAQKRGHGLSYYTPDKLSLRGEELVAPVQVLTVRDEPGDHFTLGEPKREPLSAFDVILLRQDPPFDLAYITSTHFLERLHPKTLVVNDPASVRNAPEKIFVMDFPHLMPPTLISRDLDEINAFRDTAWRRRHETVARPWRRRGVPNHAAGHEFRLAVRHVLGHLQRALGDPALPARGQARRQAHHPGRRRIRRRRQSRTARRTTFAPTWCAAVRRRPPT